MTDPIAPEISLDQMRARAEELDRTLAQTREEHSRQLVRAELKAAALRAGMIDLDGLKLLDTTGLKLDEAGELREGSDVMRKLRIAKPWLFGGANSSSAASPPPAQSPQNRRATEMSHDEWRAARSEMLRRRS
jgi:hypothetical protein